MSRREEGGGSGATPREPHEVRLDLVQILVVVGVIAALALFWLMFRSPAGGTEQPLPGVPAGNVTLGDVPEGTEDVSEDLTFFDRLGEKGRDEATGGVVARDRAGIEGVPAAGQPSGGSSSHGSADVRVVAEEGAVVGGAEKSAGNGSAGAGDAHASSGFVVQVFAGDRSGAERLRGRLVSSGYPAYVVDETGGPSRVRVGPYTTESAAKEASSRIAVAEGLSTWIIPPR